MPFLRGRKGKHQMESSSLTTSSNTLTRAITTAITERDSSSSSHNTSLGVTKENFGDAIDVFKLISEIDPHDYFRLVLRALRLCTVYYGNSSSDSIDKGLLEYVETTFDQDISHFDEAMLLKLGSLDKHLLLEINFLSIDGCQDLNGMHVRIIYKKTKETIEHSLGTKPAMNEIRIPVVPDDEFEIQLWRHKEITKGSFLRLGKGFVGVTLLLCKHVGFQSNFVDLPIINRLKKYAGTLSLRLNLKCESEEAARQLFVDHCKLSLIMLLKEHVDKTQLSWNHVLSSAAIELQERHAIGLSDTLKLIGRLFAIFKVISSFNFPLNASVLYDLMYGMNVSTLSTFEASQMQQLSRVFKTLVKTWLLQPESFFVKTTIERVHLLGILSVCSMFEQCGYPEALGVAETAACAQIIKVGIDKAHEIATFSDDNKAPLHVILEAIRQCVNSFRELRETIHNSWGIELGSLAADEFRAFVRSYRIAIGALENPEDALKVYQQLQSLCVEFNVSSMLMRGCFSDKLICEWLEKKAKEDWVQEFVREDDLIEGCGGYLVSHNCQEFLAKLHDILRGIYKMSSMELDVAEAYGKALCSCALEYVVATKEILHSREFLKSGTILGGFQTEVCVALNNVASVHTLLVKDLKEMVDARDDCEKAQWEHLCGNIDTTDRWSPRQTVNDIRIHFHDILEIFAGVIAEKCGDFACLTCEEETKKTEDKANRLNRLLVSLLNSLKPKLYGTVFLRLIEIIYNAILEKLESRVIAAKKSTETLSAAGIEECLAVFRACFLNPENALPLHKLETVTFRFLRDEAIRLSDSVQKHAVLSDIDITSAK